ncbi:hypothetical protein LTR84_012214 [Exophiala bonariae]|uniref:HpcH/HpaI aldolase/citrate lyase domain-containing protein n=1 Tax=Exophiala bonariae TaxID=1690606 RepID=A0AAV9NFI7_9EURO|nr:hypothetical protein LTR84_012214 [Exophiala bonariae]
MAQIAIYRNNLLDNLREDRVCTAFGIKIIPTGEIVQIAKQAGYGSLFIDLEHTTLTLKDASQLCITGLCAGITPFVRVPHECGSGFIQRVLDGGAMGIIVPHILGVGMAVKSVENDHGANYMIEDARKVIQTSKFPPLGKRSLTAGLPHFGYAPTPATATAPQLNESGSTVFIMIETADALETVDDIAALPGCDVLLVGANDLATELGIMGDFDHPKFMQALEKVSNASKTHNKVFAIGGLYHRPDLMDRVVNDLGARWVIGGQDVGMLVNATRQNCLALKAIQRS